MSYNESCVCHKCGLGQLAWVDWLILGVLASLLYILILIFRETLGSIVRRQQTTETDTYR